MTDSRALYSNAISSLFSDEDIAFERHELEGETLFTISIGIDNGPGMIIKLIIDNSDSVKLRCRMFRKIPKEKRREIIRTLNQLNTQYRFLCFCLDDEGTVSATYDFNLYNDEEEAAGFAKQMMVLFLNIADDCIPKIAKTLWS